MDKRRGRKMPLYEKVCLDCGTDFKGGNRALRCKPCAKYSQFKTNMLDYKWRLGKLANAARSRASSKNLPFDITQEYLISLWEAHGGSCSLTGVPLDLSSWGDKGQVNPNAPSVDRIVPSKGYVKGNVRLITYHMNISLSDFGTAQFENLINNYLRYNS